MNERATRKPRTAEEWATYIKVRQADVAELQRRLAAGEDEVTTARSLGFATRNDVNRHVAAVIARSANRQKLA